MFNTNEAGFNSIVFDLLRKYGCIVEIVEATAGSAHLRFNLPNNRVSGFAAPRMFKTDRFSAATSHLTDADRMEFFQSDESCYAAARVLKAFAMHGKALSDLAENTRLSGDGKLEVAVAAASTAIAAIGMQYGALAKLRDALKRKEAELYAVPTPDAADAIVDVELRARFDRLSEPEQLGFATKLTTEGNQRILLALIRAAWPYGEVTSQWIQKAWRTYAALQNQDGVVEYEVQRENNDWAIGLSAQFFGIVTNPSLSGSNGRIEQFDLYRILKPVGGLGLLELPAQQLQMHERRLLEAKAA